MVGCKGFQVHIFQRGWFNQLVIRWIFFRKRLKLQSVEWHAWRIIPGRTWIRIRGSKIGPWWVAFSFSDPKDQVGWYSPFQMDVKKNRHVSKQVLGWSFKWILFLKVGFVGKMRSEEWPRLRVRPLDYAVCRMPFNQKSDQFSVLK